MFFSNYYYLQSVYFELSQDVVSILPLSYRVANSAVTSITG